MAMEKKADSGRAAIPLPAYKQGTNFPWAGVPPSPVPGRGQGPSSLEMEMSLDITLTYH